MPLKAHAVFAVLACGSYRIIQSRASRKQVQMSRFLLVGIHTDGLLNSRNMQENVVSGLDKDGPGR